MVQLRLKLLAAVSRARGASNKNLIRPARSSSHHIGHAALVSGLIGAAPLHPLSPPTAIFESVPDSIVDLSQAKTALRVLAALGDGFVGVPWLKGTAGIGLEIVNALDVSRRNQWFQYIVCADHPLFTLN